MPLTHDLRAKLFERLSKEQRLLPSEAARALRIFEDLDDDLLEAARVWADGGELPDAPTICGLSPANLAQVYTDVPVIFCALQDFRVDPRAEEIAVSLSTVVRRRYDLRFDVPEVVENADATEAERDYLAWRIAPKDTPDLQWDRVRRIVDEVARTCSPDIWTAIRSWSHTGHWPHEPDIGGVTPAYLSRKLGDRPELILNCLLQLGQDPALGVVAIEQYIYHHLAYGYLT